MSISDRIVIHHHPFLMQFLIVIRKLKAVINKNTPFEISWTLDDPVTPMLVENIKIAGDKIGTNWEELKFRTAVDLLLNKFDKNELLEMMYDEDQEVLEIATLAMSNPLTGDMEELKRMVRLYLPIMIIIVMEQNN